MKTGRNIQRAMFLSSLWAEMDKMSDSFRTGELEKQAQEYLNQGLSEQETEELLFVDGYDADAVHSCLQMLNEDEIPCEPDDGCRWGFEIEDQYGRITTNFDLGTTIIATTDEDALERANAEVRSNGGLGQVTRVFRL